LIARSKVYGARYTVKENLIFFPMSEIKTKKRRRAKEYLCSCCGDKPLFCWTCPCGFQICNKCMEENQWGLTCSGVNWQCPDCGSLRPF
jgi:hypothetical protein